MKGKKVFVGLSGGVDSAVTAALCKEAGASVTGVFIKGWYPPGLPCTWSDDRRDAMRVAARLGIPFLTLDASIEYKQSVIDYLIREYGAGRTPNPDIMCNREVKFGAFYRFAREQGADFIATGHYARLEDDKLKRGIDSGKDQSYFLWAVPKEVLEHALFPLGELKKSEVRELAKKFDLPVAKKRDSQGICFLGDVSLESFLSHEIGLTQGEAIDTQGKHVGIHQGSIAYTLGERASLLESKPGPWYVVGKDITTNQLMVSHEPRSVSPAAEEAIALSETNWFTGIDHARTYEAQYRYHGPRIRGTVEGNTFVPDAPLEEIPAPGQSLVLYDGEHLIGGGIIAA